MNPFEVRDCALLRKMSGLAPAYNLRELRDRISVCRPDVLYHHFCETPLSPSFDYPDYRNDFAIWATRRLGDRVLAERLGIIDPYLFTSLEDLRETVLEILDERLSELTMVPWARPGHEFYFMQATTIVFDTGERIDHPEDLATAVSRMTGGSIYFHFLEARRRPPVGLDDFSAWLSDMGIDGNPFSEALQSIDFAFSTLTELRSELVEALLFRKRQIRKEKRP